MDGIVQIGDFAAGNQKAAGDLWRLRPSSFSGKRSYADFGLQARQTDT
jgi:hypothetical protein